MASTLSDGAVLAPLPVELWGEIFSNVPSHSDGSRWRADLARLARTSRTFSEPALDVLWKELTEVEALLRLIPADALETTTLNNHTTYTLTRDLRIKDWLYFDIYARRVRTLRYSYGGRFNYDIIGDLWQQRKGPLLPSLSALDWDHSVEPITYELIPVLASFITPDIRRFDLNGMRKNSNNVLPDYNQLVADFLRLLPDKASRLESLTLGGNIPAIALDFLGRFRYLKKLDLSGVLMRKDPVTVDVLHALSALNTLISLSLRIKGLGPGQLPPQWNAPSTFPILEGIYLRDTSIPMAIATATELQTKCLQDFRFEGDSEDVTLTQLRGLCGGLTRYNSTLTSISIKVDQLLSSGPYDRSRIMFGIEPLLELHHLVSVSLISGHERGGMRPFLPLTVTDNDIERMASAWPALEALDLRMDIFGLSYRSLVSVAQHCLHIKTLRLYELSAHALINVELLPNGKNSLRTISINHMDISSPYNFAEALDRLFPRLVIHDEDLLAPAVAIYLRIVRSENEMRRRLSP